MTSSQTRARAMRVALAMLLAGLPLAMASPAAAKPKKNTVNGCTAEQIQSPQAKDCIDQMQKDILAGYAYPHALYCDETGMYCCQCCIEHSAGTGNFSCKSVGLVAPPSTGMPRPPMGGVLEPPGGTGGGSGPAGRPSIKAPAGSRAY